MAGTVEFDRLVSYFDADLTPLEKGVAKGMKLVDKLENRLKNFKGKLNIGTTSGTGAGSSPIDKEIRAAEADIRRFERERVNAERAVTRQIEREARQQANIRTREYKRSMNQMIADSRKRERAERSSSFLSNLGGRSALGGALAFGAGAGAVLGITTGLTSIASEGRDAYVSLEKLVRFAATLDQSFQTPQMLLKLRKDIEGLSLEVPQSAENIAKAAFTIKSAYSKMTEPELINFLRKFSIMATASNTTVDQHAERVAALAKMYKITADELDSFGAIISTSFGDALATDSQVGEGFNKVLVSARLLKQPLNEVAAAMGAIQSTSSDAERNTTNLQNVFAKLADPKYVAGMKEVFNIDVFDATGKFRGLNAIVNDLAKSMEGLTDREKSAKIGEVFKDLQAREGLMSLIEVLGQYNDRLRDGADADAWKVKQETMLNSADSKWQMLMNRVDEYKRALGKGITDPITAGADSQTTGGGSVLVMAETKHSIQKGYLSIFEAIASGSTKINTELQMGLGLTDPATSERVQQGITRFFEEQRDHYASQADISKIMVLQSQQKYFEDIANDPKSNDALRAGARKKADALKATLDEMVAKYAEARKAAAEKIAAATIAGTDVSAQAETSGSMSGLAWTGGLVGAMIASQGEVQTAQSAAIQPNTADASQKGSSLGQSFVSGMVNALRSGGGPIGSAVAGLIDQAFSSGQAAQDSHSPSRRAAAELGIPFVQGIEMGIKARADALANSTSGLINGALFGPKTKKRPKKETDDMIRSLIGDLGDENSRIGSNLERSKQSIARFYDAVLADATVSYDSQVASVVDFYQKIYDQEESAYQKRLANIAQREEAVRKLKKIKPEERERELRRLGDERTGVIADREQGVFDWRKNRDSELGDAGSRNVDNRQRELARQQLQAEIELIGVRRSAEAEAQTQNQNELNRIDNLIDALRDERSNYEAGTSEFVEYSNKIADAEQDRADAVVKGTGEVKRARLDDKRTLEDYLRSLGDFARQTSESQFDADQARIEAMKAAGVKQEEVFAAEQALEIRQENFRNSMRVAEIAANRDSLLQLATTEAQKLQITTDANSQMEAETRRHQSIMGQLTAQQGQNSILGQWRAMAAQLPSYSSQFRDFAGSLPDVIGGAFAGGMQQMDGTWKSFWESAKQTFFQSIQAMLAELARVQLIKGVIGMFSAIAGGFGGGGSGGGSITDGFSGSSWYMNGFADGGVPPMNSVSMVGENGPELFVPSVSGRVLSHEDSMKAIGGGKGGDTYNMSVTQVFKGPRGIVSPRSTRQQTEAAVTGLSYASKGRR